MDNRLGDVKDAILEGLIHRAQDKVITLGLDPKQEDLLLASITRPESKDKVSLRNAALRMYGDTRQDMHATTAAHILGTLGFQWAADYSYSFWDDTVRENRYMTELILAHPLKGIVLSLEVGSLSMDTLDPYYLYSAKMFYAWTPAPSRMNVSPSMFLQSGSWKSISDPRVNVMEPSGRPHLEDIFWSGSHSGASGLKFLICLLYSYGNYLNPWPKNRCNRFGLFRSIGDSLETFQKRGTAWVRTPPLTPRGIQEKDARIFNSLAPWVKEIINGNI